MAHQHPGPPIPGLYAFHPQWMSQVPSHPAAAVLGKRPGEAVSEEPASKRQAVEATGYQPPEVSQQGRRSLEDFVENFAKDPSTSTHTFDNSLNNVERRLIHQACLKWKLFSKSRGTGDNRTLTISKTAISLEAISPTGVINESCFDPQKEHINTPLRAWLKDVTIPSIRIENVSQEEMRYMYQLATSFGFRPAAVSENVVECIRLTAGEESKQFSYRTLFDQRTVDVKKLSSVLDAAEKPQPATVSVCIGQTAIASLRRFVLDVQNHQLVVDSAKLSTPLLKNEQPESSAPMPDLSSSYEVDDVQRVKFETFRQTLPVFKAKDEILAAIRSNRVLVLSGQTGCGKTTQIPQYILDSDILPANAPCILCTQPRRIAAMSVADRVACERGQAVGQEIGYQVRFESKLSNNTRLTFLTPGILFRRMQSDPYLRSVGCIVIDEVHERDTATDFVLMVIKQLLLKNMTQAKVVLMSATLQAEAFCQYFAEVQNETHGSIPYINVEGRQFPVKDYYLEDALKWTGFTLNQLQDAVPGSTPAMDCHSTLFQDLTELKDATQAIAEKALEAVLPKLQAALKKPYVVEKLKEVAPMAVTKGEKYRMVVRMTLPTDAADWREMELHVYKTEAGQSTLAKVKTLETSSAPATATAAASPTTTLQAVQSQPSEAVSGSSASLASSSSSVPASEPTAATAVAVSLPTPSSPSIAYVVPKPQINLIAALIYFLHAGKLDGGILVFLPGMQDIRDVDWALRRDDKIRELWVLKLHSGLPVAEQRRVFEPPPVAGLRKIVLSTNMAESSVTVSDIVYVLDSGLMKEKHYNPDSNVASLDCQFVSQVNVLQRRGRAGRVREGVCIHLFPKDHFSRLTEFPIPELCRTPLDEVCLQVKSIGNVGNIQEFIKNAMNPPPVASVTNAVTTLQDIQALCDNANNDITALGSLLATIPVPVALGRTLIVAALLGVLRPVATIVACLSVRSPFVISFDSAKSTQLKEAQKQFHPPEDLPSDHVMLLNAINAWENAPNRAAFAESNGMSLSTLSTIRSTRDQLLPLVYQGIGCDLSFADRVAHSSSLTTKQVHALTIACIAMGLYPNVAWKSMSTEHTHESAEKAMRMLVTPDGHRSAVGRDSINASRIPSQNDFFAYFERISHRGTLLLQDCSVVTAIPFALISRSVQLAGAELVLDDSIHIKCSLEEARMLKSLNDGLKGALYTVATYRNASCLPGSLLNALIDVLVHESIPRPDSTPPPGAVKPESNVLEQWSNPNPYQQPPGRNPGIPSGIPGLSPAAMQLLRGVPPIPAMPGAGMRGVGGMAFGGGPFYHHHHYQQQYYPTPPPPSGAYVPRGPPTMGFPGHVPPPYSGLHPGQMASNFRPPYNGGAGGNPYMYNPRR